MLSVAVATLRLRWRSFIGTAVALALGTALMAAMGQVLATTVTAPDRGPQRYAAVPVVVVPDDQLRVPTRHGGDSAPLAEPRGLPAELVALAGPDGRLPGAVADRVFPAQLVAGPAGSVGRPWSAARAAAQELTAGRAPRAGDEIAVSTAGRIGDRARVITGDGIREYTIVGTTGAGPEPTVFFTDARAAELSPRVDALAVWQPEAEVRAAVGDRALVLTGAARARPDPSRHADAQARNNANTIVGIALGFAAFVAVFVVASTFAFAVAQRRREFALLRAGGATPGQVRRMVYTEAAVIAVAASAAGSALGPRGAPLILDQLTTRGMAPDWVHTVSTSAVPAWLAFVTGVSVALLGALAAAWRAGRVPPGEALRSADVESTVMPPARWVLGGAALLTALVTMAVTAIGDPASATNRKTYMPVVMLLIAAAGLLAPAAVGPVVRVLVAPLARLRGAGGTVVATGVAASARRTAAVAAPVLVTIALGACLLAASAMTDAARSAIQDRAVPAGHLVLPAGTTGLDRELVERLRAVPGAEVQLVAETSVYTLEGDTALIRRPAEATTDVPEGTIVVSADWDLRVGDTAHVWLGDGTPTTLRVTGLLPTGSDADARLPLPAGVRPSVAYVAGGAPDALRQAADGHRALVLSKAEWSAANDGHRGAASRLGLLIVLGIVLAYTAIALVNTVLMAAPDRSGERRTLSLLGATRGQVLRYTAAEALVTTAVGAVLAAAVTLLALAGLWVALLRVEGPVPIDLPWTVAGALTAGCAALTVTAAVLPLRRRPT